MAYNENDSAVNEKTQNGEFDTLANIAFQKIRDEIITGKLEPGARLIRRNLAKRLGVSPIPITEALFRLEHHRLIQSEAMYGSRVRAFTLENIKSDQLILEALECQSARLCASTASPKQMEELFLKADILDGLFDEEFYTAQWRFFDEKHREFHVKIAGIAGGDSLVDEINRIWYCYQVWFRRIITHDKTDAVELLKVPNNWHRDLIAAFSTRDPLQAEEAMRQHLTYFNEKVVTAAENILIGD
ncbi:MAG: GntR family transcriptional regulator [Planctomycetes bacterium]|nr:GntR family transcriptional regulator [Planctomycetota bacterium]